MDTIDLCGGEQGSIWSRKPNPRQKDGFVLGISNTRVGLTAKGRRVPFTKVAFGSHGSWCIATDQLGTLYCFDIGRNKYQVIHRFGQVCTAILCSHTHPNQVFVATADSCVKCVNIDTHQVTDTVGPHETTVKSLSLHQSGRYLLVVTSCDSVLWDIQTGHRCRTLSGGETVGVQDVFFLPMSDSVLTCFRDDSIHAWETDTLEYKYLLPSPSGPSPRYRTFATTLDGRVLVAGGRSNVLHIWDMNRHTLKHVVQLPPKMKQIQLLLFVPNTLNGEYLSELLGVLSQDGILRFIALSGYKPLFQLGSDEDMINTAHIDHTGQHVIAINGQGSLLFHDISHLIKQQKPQAPILQLSDTFPSPPSQISRLSDSRPPTRTSVTEGKSQTQRGTGLSSSTNISTVGGVKMNLTKLKSILKGYGEYPAKYRSFIWRSLLQLPENHSAYSVLLKKGIHPSCTNLHVNYPIKSPKLMRILQRVLSAIAHWSSLFSEVDYLPALVFPFVKLFQNNQLVAFEMVATILFNWCSLWYEYFPNPPLNILAMVENILSHYDPHLLEHLVQHKITARTYAWPLLHTVFSEVLSKDEWLKLWDNILSQPLSFLLMVTAAYLSTARQTLLKCTTTEDVEYFVHHQSSVNINTVIQDSYRMQETTPTEIHPQETLGVFTPLTRHTYPVFNKYPKFIVDFQLQERERIMKEEQEYLRQRQQTLELERLVEQRKYEEESWQRQQDLLLTAEEERKRMIELEDQKLSDQRSRLGAMKRETRMKELKALDDTRKRYLDQQQNIREAEIKKMDKEIQRKILLRDRETHEAIEDVELRTLELQAQRSRMEQELAHRHDQAMYRLRNNFQVEDERLMNSETISGSHSLQDKEREKIHQAQLRLAKLETDKLCMDDEELVRAKHELHRLRSELQDEELNEKQQMCQLEQDKLERTIRQVDEEEGHHVSSDMESYKSDTNPLSQYHDEVLQWSQQRLQLNTQEAELLSRIHNLRRRVASHMMDTSSRSSSVKEEI